jgi:ribosomal protein S27E
MQSLDDFNRDRQREFDDMPKSGPNGIACPNCGNELDDTGRRVILDTKPPQTPVHCTGCGRPDWRFLRLAGT